MSETEYQEIQLGTGSHAFLLDALSCDGALGDRLIESCNLAGGRVTTYLPVGTSTSKLLRFSEGGIAGYEITRSWVAGVAMGFAHADRQHALVVHSNAGRPGAAFIERSGRPRFIFEEDVYFYITNDRMTSEAVADAIRFGQSAWSGFGMMVESLGSVPLCSVVCAVTLDDLKFLVEGMQKFFVSAYDGEGYLVWHRE